MIAQKIETQYVMKTKSWTFYLILLSYQIFIKEHVTNDLRTGHILTCYTDI